MKITDHFDSTEWTCKDGTLYPLDRLEDGAGIPTGWTPPADKPRTWQWTRLYPEALMLEVVRAAAIEKYKLTPDQARITIISGYRDDAYDQKIYEAHVEAFGDDGMVAPASTSIHPKGAATDFKHAVLEPSKIFALIFELFAAGKLPYVGGVGLYPGFVHLDARPRTHGGEHLAIWGGRRPSNIG